MREWEIGAVENIHGALPYIRFAPILALVGVNRIGKVHPNQVSTWKRQAIDGLGDVFSGGADRARSDHGSEIKELHAKIGELTVVNDFLARGLKR